VNEIDISKVKDGQSVKIGVDAFPDRKYTGLVTEVANIGQQLPNTNAKVFEVIIEVNEFDSILRPAMTTKNEILTATLDSVLYLPLDCVQSNDTMSYVYISGARKQIILGQSNENEVVIKEGLEEGEMVYLVPPSDAEDSRLVKLDPEIIERIKAEEEESRQKAKEREKQAADDMREMSPEMIQKLMKEGKLPKKGGGKRGGRSKP
jgi:multidrug efflux pump subunit AcrA (membrane-fusion protein)